MSDQKELYSTNNLKAIDAKSLAQKIASGPMLFQTACILLERGVFKALDEAGAEGLSKQEVSKLSGIPYYGIDVLFDMALSGELIYRKAEKFFLSKVGFFMLNDDMTRINLEFTKNCCYEAMQYLDEAVMTGTAAGLKVFNPEWKTIYPYLGALPEKAKKSWFDWDHYYSDCAIGEAVKLVLDRKPEVINDVGGNRGEFSIACVNKDPDVHMNIFDLPPQVAMAKKIVSDLNLSSRIGFVPLDILKDDIRDDSEADIWWMSQFLDCFSQEQIERILSNIHAVMKPGAVLAILEPFWDRQKFEAARFSINAGSLYFTVLANGNSRFYHSEVLSGMLDRCGFKVTSIHDNLGISHSLMFCEMK